MPRECTRPYGDGDWGYYSLARFALSAVTHSTYNPTQSYAHTHTHTHMHTMDKQESSKYDNKAKTLAYTYRRYETLEPLVRNFMLTVDEENCSWKTAMTTNGWMDGRTDGRTNGRQIR